MEGYFLLLEPLTEGPGPPAEAGKVGWVHLTPHPKQDHVWWPSWSQVPGQRLERLRPAVLFSAMGHTASPTPCLVPWFSSVSIYHIL